MNPEQQDRSPEDQDFASLLHDARKVKAALSQLPQEQQQELYNALTLVIAPFLEKALQVRDRLPDLKRILEDFHRFQRELLAYQQQSQNAS